VFEMMKKIALMIAAVIAAAGFWGCRSARSAVAMGDEGDRLEKELANLETERDRSKIARASLEAELGRTRAAYEEMRLALARRDALQGEFDGLRYADGGTGYATVAEFEGGQIRRDEVGGTGGVRGSGTGEGSADTGGSRSGSRGAGMYRPGTSGRYHVVARGECLYAIAGYKQYYGDPDMWPTIYEANRYQIQDPHWIFIGQRLQIP
jgi:nucleoid-associated protein YgaU